MCHTGNRALPRPEARTSGPRTMDSVRWGLLVCVLMVALAGAGPAAAARPKTVEVVVTLDAPPLARAVAASRALSTTAKSRRLDLRSPTSVSYLHSLASSQRAVERRIVHAFPAAQLRWRYGVVANGLAVVVPAGAEARLARLPGVARVYESVRYHATLDRSPALIGAPTLWGPNLSSAGAGMKIGIIDDGLDQRHEFFSPAGYSMPPGFPKGQAAYTTAKVIVARAFPPRTPTYRNAGRPFDPLQSEHATHVAGIAAGNANVSAGARVISGLAPRAYLGNYKVLTIPTDAGVGLDGNSPEIVAGIEAAVRDGMDVINLSLGEPEIEGSRDLVVSAINAAADAGVVPAIAAGNDFNSFGRGTVGSPGSAAKAITVAAVSKARRIASFSSSGPTPISLQLKPEVSAPGESILSSVPAPSLWAVFSGTSMAAPHIAGAAAILKQRHPGWTVAQLKSALTLTGDPALTEGGQAQLPATRQGGGIVNLPRADNPLLFTSPTTLSFGFVSTGSTSRNVQLADAGGGAGAWAAGIEQQSGPAGVTISVPLSVTVPGSFTVTTVVPAGTVQGELTGYVVLTRGAERRRIPFWLRVVAPALGRQTRTTLARTGTYRGNTTGRQALVETYRYPDNPSGSRLLSGPEQVFRFRLTRPVANFGVAVLSRAAGVDVEPRIVVAGDENRQVGYASLPINLNPYLRSFLRRVLASAALRPAPGSYDIVFDTPSRGAAGRFTFRFWVGDDTAPTLRLMTPSIRGDRVVLRLTDAGSGVDSSSITASIDGEPTAVAFTRSKGRLVVRASSPLRLGRHQLTVRVSDYQETKNNENVTRILPNTRVLRTSFSVR